MKQSDLKMALEQLHLVEAILDRHGLDGPATHKRNSTSIPIDRIWKTQGLQIKRGGYFGYNEVFMNADHRCLWLDLAFTSAFGHDLPLARKITPKRLHCKDPRLVDNFINLYHKFAASLQLFDRVQHLYANAKTMSKAEVIAAYEDRDLIRCQATAFAESKCRKLRTGQVAFSPELNEARMKIKAWLLLVSKAKGRKTSCRMISRALKFATIPTEACGYDEPILQEKLKAAYQEY